MNRSGARSSFFIREDTTCGFPSLRLASCTLFILPASRHDCHHCAPAVTHPIAPGHTDNLCYKGASVCVWGGGVRCMRRRQPQTHIHADIPVDSLSLYANSESCRSLFYRNLTEQEDVERVEKERVGEAECSAAAAPPSEPQLAPKPSHSSSLVLVFNFLPGT